MHIQKTASNANAVLSSFLHSAAHMNRIERQSWWGTVFVYRIARFTYAIETVDYITGPAARGRAEDRVRSEYTTAAACIAHERNHKGETRDTLLARHATPMGVL